MIYQKKIETPPPYFSETLQSPVIVDKITLRVLLAVEKEFGLNLSQALERVCGDWWFGRSNPRGGRAVPE